MADKSSDRPSEFWTQQERLQLRPYLNGATMYIQTGFMTGDQEMIEKGSKVLSALIKIKTILHSLDQAHGKIGAAASKVGMTRNGLYFAIQSLHLDHKDFKTEGVTAISLLQKSKVAPIAEEIAEAVKTQWQGRT